MGRIDENHPAIKTARKKGLIRSEGKAATLAHLLAEREAISGVGKAAPALRVNRVTLPAPPSTNKLFINKRGGARGCRGRIKSPAYRAWLETVAPLLTAMTPPPLPTKLRIHIHGKYNESRDGDNFGKAIQDAIVAAGVIRDDCLRYVTGGEWSYTPGPGEALVDVWFESPRGAP